MNGRARFGWVLNLDAELELARARPGYVPRTKLLSQLAEHGSGARALLGPGDALLVPGKLEAPGLIGRAWCPTPMALSAMRAAGVEPEPHPTPSTLRRVNHRRFAHELGGGLPGQRYLEDRASLELLLAQPEGRWLLKRPLSFAGRGQLRAYGTITSKQWSWIDASLRVDGLIVEPLVAPTLELSLHGFVWRDGRSELGRVCVQRVSERGTFHEARLAREGELQQQERLALYERAESVALALGREGYFGPFGIDGYRYELNEGQSFCALGEINARYTLGFCVGFPRHPSELVID